MKHFIIGNKTTLSAGDERMSLILHLYHIFSQVSSCCNFGCWNERIRHFFNDLTVLVFGLQRKSLQHRSG